MPTSPIFQANFSMFADLNSTAPVAPQGTLWAEVWRFEGVNASTAPACETPAALADHLRQWDSDLRTNYKRAVDTAAAAAAPAAALLPPLVGHGRSNTTCSIRVGANCHKVDLNLSKQFEVAAVADYCDACRVDSRKGCAGKVRRRLLPQDVVRWPGSRLSQHLRRDVRWQAIPLC